ncbi:MULTISPECIES: NAD(P)/FAD-dependent oxidoreductase [Oxalobacteraceae]|uniref:NAD(P)/FAD-dependent oxidoreductase n=1 Tax=Herminiimonas sp. Marseille-P9896 TaxID=2742211 RepID=UPI00158C561B|nr:MULTISPECIES: FAD-dependent oxidoreductase [Oxalobacteraceae]
MKIAVIGSGIAGLSCAWRLASSGYDVTLFEANDYYGGHTHTVNVTLDGVTHGVDTGFLVFNHQTYPQLVKLFDELDVATAATDMSFSVKLPLPGRTLEWAGGDLDAVFAQRRNLLSPRFLGMLRDILRFNRHATALALGQNEAGVNESLGAYLERHHYSKEFRDWYLLPMAGCIWSCPTGQMLDFPVLSFIRFCHNHGLLQVNDRPQWHTVMGGARHYVEKMLAEIPHKHLHTPVFSINRSTLTNTGLIRVEASNGTHMFHQVVLAGHSDQSLRLLQDANEAEHEILAAVQYQPNRAVLHLDTSCLPENRKTWSAWNYQSATCDEARVCVHYLLNQLQPLPFKQALLVSLNPIDEPPADSVLGSYDYAHPIFDAAAITAQYQLPGIQGLQNTWFAGAWTGYGFHEDGLKSGLAVATDIMRISGMRTHRSQAA